MNRKDYAYWFLKTYGEGRGTYDRAGCGGPVLMACLLLAFLLYSCKTQYVPVEMVRTEWKTQYIHDSIRVEVSKNDCTSIEHRGDTVFVDRWHTQYRDRWRDRIVNDTVIKEKEVQVPYPVERKLTRWEQFCLDYGKVTTGGTVVCLFLIIAYLVRRIKRPK